MKIAFKFKFQFKNHCLKQKKKGWCAYIKNNFPRIISSLDLYRLPFTGDELFDHFFTSLLGHSAALQLKKANNKKSPRKSIENNGSDNKNLKKSTSSSNSSLKNANNDVDFIQKFEPRSVNVIGCKLNVTQLSKLLENSSRLTHLNISFNPSLSMSNSLKSVK